MNVALIRLDRQIGATHLVPIIDLAFVNYLILTNPAFSMSFWLAGVNNQLA
jgi:hypothetical protein